MEKWKRLYEKQAKRNQKLNAELIEVKKRLIRAERCMRLLKLTPINFEE